MMAVYCTPASGDPHGLKKIAWRIRAHGYESLGGVWGGMGKEVIIEDPVSIKYAVCALLGLPCLEVDIIELGRRREGDIFQ
ncbi:hypothetical protein ACOSQ3_023967 [Xanthoceras sorbifolium]